MSEFNDQFKPAHVEPAFGNDGTANDFYDRLAEQMGEVPEMNEADYRKMVVAMRQLLNWMATVNLSDKRCLKSMGLRVLAAVWVVDPARFKNRSLHNIALELGFGANNIAPLTADFSERFGITNQFQSHNWRTKV